MKTHYLCCEGNFDNLTVKYYAENSQAAIAYLETHGGGIFHNTEKQFKMCIWGCKSPTDKGVIE
ncbi:MAG TPA: hypothetical protein VIF37_17145 [Methylobacter sp.]|jgi:hypothetical protein